MTLARALLASVGLRRQNRLLSRRYRGWALGLFVCVVVIQQGAQYRAAGVDDRYQNTLNNGTNHARYYPFFHCFSAFPVQLMSLSWSEITTCDDLQRHVSDSAIKPEIVPDQYNRSTVWLFGVDRWLTGGPLLPVSMRPALALIFTVSLVAIVIAFFALRLPLLGFGLAILCGSDPFQVFEIYGRITSNVFSLVISVGLLATALTLIGLRLIRDSRRVARLAALVAALATGAVLGIQYDMRLEGVGVGAGVAVVMAFFPAIRWWRRALVLACVLAGALTANRLIDVSFDGLFKNANKVVHLHGGVPVANAATDYRTQWWAIWSGLGDYDQKYGFLVDDRAGLSYAASLVDGPGQFEDALREDVLRTIRQDPLWFAGIIGQRLLVILLHNTPYRLSFGSSYVDLPIPPAVVTAFVLAGLVVAWRRRQAAVLVAASVLMLSIPLVSLAQLGRYGLEFYSVAHLFCLALVGCWLVEAVLVCTVRRPARPASKNSHASVRL